MSNMNVLSQRYAGPEINAIFSEEGRILAERDLWIAVMKAQKELGIAIPADVIEGYEAARDNIDLDFIQQREIETKHDVKAKIEGFVKASGKDEHIHKGMTSRDLTDNVEQMQFKKASRIILGRYVSVLRHMLDRASAYDHIVLTARTHHQAAQPTLLGRRFSMWAEELLTHILNFESFLNTYPLRGIKGPVGTQFDMLTLLEDPAKVQMLEKRVAQTLGFERVLDSTGQVYPRSLDYALLSQLALMGSACENFAKGMRLMSGYELLTEGFKEGQVGSSAMPHKMNTRSAERICGFSTLIKMYADGASRMAGDQWEEGDVSCSVIRRIVMPDALYASDGLCETTLTVLSNMGAYPVIIDKEVDRYLPFLASTEILMTAVKAGVGRETAHEAIKRHAVSEAMAMREKGASPRLPEKLGSDAVFKAAGITEAQINHILEDKAHFVGNAAQQIKQVAAKASSLLDRYAEEARYEPGEIL
ncbi:MAG: adenylosuccinate lyase [Desulfobacteraceae bacterium 4572_87]|nr:MAG: adenylosuccinate lyase [Desulfobacteraceae bacterium 4572_87]